MKKSLSLVCACLLLISSVFVSPAFALTSKYDKGVKVLKSPAVEYESPTWFTPFSLEDAPEDISYRLSILPYADDQDELLYIVMPTLGLITPVVFVPEDSADYTAMVSGQEIDINAYLPNGVMHYASSGMPGDVGNPVIFGHSNYFSDQPGNYKSIFADIMNLDVSPTDEMRTFTKNGSGEYDLQKFSIGESYETDPSDVGILTPKGGKELTVFACTDGLKGRWILRGRLIEDNEVLVPYSMKYQMQDIVGGLSQSASKQGIIVEGMKMISAIRDNMPETSSSYNEKMKKYVLNYIERELIKVF